MSRTLIDLLTIDELAKRVGGYGGLHPRLRAAIETALRFPAQAASPMPTGPTPDHGLPENTTRFPRRDLTESKSA